MVGKLAIATRYLRREVTYAALQLADSTCQQGIPVRVVARDDYRSDVSGWDDKVIDARKYALGEWLRGCDAVIWTRVPYMCEVNYAKERGITTCLLINWEELYPQYEGIVREMDRVITPYRCALHNLQAHWYLDHVKAIYLPWYVPAPVSQPDLMRKGMTVYFPLYDSQPQRADQAVFTLMARVLEEFKETSVSVAYGYKWARSSRRILKRLKQQYGNRLIAYGPPDRYSRMELFAKADLTVWLPRFESFALIGLASLAMSTPVITWDMRPQNEYLQAWKNSVLVPCSTGENWLGVPEVVGGYKQFEEMLLSTLRDRALIAKLKCATSNGLEARRKQFNTAWSDFLRE